jgi:excisionase family DNA binding protein
VSPAALATPAVRLLTADDLAERWQVPKSHIYRLTREGKLPTVRLGRYYRYAARQVEEFEAAGGTGG